MTRHLSVSFALALGTLVSSLSAAAPLERDPWPPRLRPCCPLGRELKPNVGALTMPIRLDNIVAADRLGTHTYVGRSSVYEHSGLVYTCRGGFVDIGHLRTAADWTAYLYTALEPHLGRDALLKLPEEAGPTQVRLIAGTLGPDPAATRMAVAQRIAYEVAVWHEIVTWHGTKTVNFFSELFSAFSPEDLYSDLLGVMIAEHAIADPQSYDAAIDHHVPAALAALDARTVPQTSAALDAVAGQWWRPGARLPRKDLLVRRNLDLGPSITPWRVSAAPGCEDTPAATLHVPQIGSRGEPLTALYRLELGVDDDLGPRMLPGSEGTVRTPADFPAMVDVIRDQMVQEGGAHSVEWSGAVAETHSVAPAAQVAPPRRPAADLQGIRLLQLEGFGGARGLKRPQGFGGFGVVGGEAQTAGGDLSILRLRGVYDPLGTGVITHLTGIQSRGMFTCTERGTGDLRAPVLSWFADCDGSGWFGVSGKLFQIQIEGATGRTVLRPIELNLAANLLFNGGSLEYLLRHVILWIGLSVDSADPADLPRLTDVSLRGHAGLLGTFRSESLAWELQLFGNVRQDFTELNDRGWEAAVRALYRFVLETDDETFGGDPWAYLTLGVEGGYTFWEDPDDAIADFVMPLGSGRKQTYQLRGFLGFSYEAFTL